MAVIRWEVFEITKEWDGETCEFKAVVISVHKFLFDGVVYFSATKEMKIGQEFQDALNGHIYKRL